MALFSSIAALFYCGALGAIEDGAPQFKRFYTVPALVHLPNSAFHNLSTIDVYDCLSEAIFSRKRYETIKRKKVGFALTRTWDCILTPQRVRLHDHPGDRLMWMSCSKWFSFPMSMFDLLKTSWCFVSRSSYCCWYCSRTWILALLK